MKSKLVRKGIQEGLSVEESRASVAAKVVATFENAKAEVVNATLSEWVVAFCVDATPLRTDGSKIAIFGTQIFTTFDKAVARAVAKDINGQLGETSTVQIERASAWRKRRVVKLDELIAQARGAL